MSGVAARESWLSLKPGVITDDERAWVERLADELGYRDGWWLFTNAAMRLERDWWHMDRKAVESTLERLRLLEDSNGRA